MELDLPISAALIKAITGIILQDLWSLLLYLCIGIIAGVVLAIFSYRLIRAKDWFTRDVNSRTLRILLYALRGTFYIAIIGFSSTVALIMGSNHIVSKEVSCIVDESVKYCKTNYFKDYTLIEEVFEVSDKLYSSGSDVNKMNHAIAEAMVNQISEKYGLGFLGSYILKSPESEMVKYLEDIEKGIIFIMVSKGLEQVGAEDLIEPDQLDKAFYSWLHSDTEKGLGSVNSFISKQISNQIKPFVFALWLPFLMINLLFILINMAEVAFFFHRKRRLKS